jgi:hypothetical protein
MAWTAPKTYSVGELQTAADFNTYIRDNFLIAKDALIAGGSVQMIWYDSLNGKNPVVDGTTHSDWSLCDGGTYNTYATPDLRNRFLVGATDTYAHKATGGATTSAHTHDDGTLTTGDNDSDHNHANPDTGTVTVGTAISFFTPNTGSDVVYAGHVHPQAATGLVSENHGHSVNAGDTGSTAPSILPPYYGAGFFLYCPA